MIGLGNVEEVDIVDNDVYLDEFLLSNVMRELARGGISTGAPD